MAAVTSATDPPNGISVYGHPSPFSSATTTPTNNSPSVPQTSQPRPPHSRQSSRPDIYSYAPVALRPSGHPSKSCPLTPPRSVHGSPGSLNDGILDDSVSYQAATKSKLRGDITKVAENQWMKNEQLGEVTGQPTRDHWKADSASPSCDSPTCRSSFGLFLRRHHCRHCGHVFCSSHTPHLVPLDQKAQFHPHGIPSRACDLCWSAYQRWQESRSRRLYMIQHSLDMQNNEETDSQHVDDPPDDSLKPALPSTLGQNAEIAASVPRGWNWSTF